jgi:hypothetical protein
MGILSLGTSAKGNQGSEHQDRLNGGYYLLDHLCEDEAKLPMLFLVKDAPPEIEKYADRISKTAKESIAAIEHMQENDALLKFDTNPLPPIEQDVRDSIQDDKQHQLLFGTTGAEFVRAFLVSQIEASNYAIHLAKVLSEQEKDSDRVQKLQHLSSQWQTVHREAFRLLQNQSVSPK